MENIQTEKLEVTQKPSARSTKINLNILSVWGPPIIALVLFLLIWQFGTLLLQIPPYIMPKPTDVLAATIENWSRLVNSATTTILESVIGFVFSVLIGVSAAIIMASSKILERSLYPYAILLQTIPIVAIAPIIVIWFGSGMNAIVIIAFTIGFFPMLSNTLIGLNATDRSMIDLLSLYKASKWQIMWKIRIPAALPYIVAGLKISCTLAIIGAIVGEYIAGIGGGDGGLGYAITVASTTMEIPYLFACGIAASILGIVFFLLVSLFSKLVLGSWHESEMKKER
ncbi:ABC transporter permease [Aquibacillus koreensis]|uniref:ABC transporter permease n=1 Tax=Aquibacillus koreensis TaxID=279446 RepID=A0A9X4AIN8_9BACI|nr:ABC transporter permease [Aquibacillus koreensis]MCT2537786.1 ABC transporter permease [Aquibacillus koreensis]MDC3421181.1 ABC transporter permease [Aquibacillus koreensis]